MRRGIGSCRRGPAHPQPLRASLPVPTTDTCDLVCLNGGSCFLNARKQAKCRCQPRYNGDKCQIDQCWDYCQNGGTCAASPSGEPGGSQPVLCGRMDGQVDTELTGLIPRNADMPLPHRLHRAPVQPAGVHGLLPAQRQLHRQPGQPAHLPLPAHLHRGPLPVP